MKLCAKHARKIQPPPKKNRKKISKEGISSSDQDLRVLARTNTQAVLRSYVPSHQKLSMLVDLLGMTLGEFQNLIDSCALGAFSAVEMRGLLVSLFPECENRKKALRALDVSD